MSNVTNRARCLSAGGEAAKSGEWRAESQDSWVLLLALGAEWGLVVRGEGLGDREPGLLGSISGFTVDSLLG